MLLLCIIFADITLQSDNTNDAGVLANQLTTAIVLPKIVSPPVDPIDPTIIQKKDEVEEDTNNVGNTTITRSDDSNDLGTSSAFIILSLFVMK